jgi:Phasin protein
MDGRRISVRALRTMHYHGAPLAFDPLEELSMTDRTYDLNSWLESYQQTCSSFGKVQQEGLKSLERFVRLHQGLAAEVLEGGLAQARLTLSARPAGTQALTELLRKHAELAVQLSEKLKTRAAELTQLAREVQKAAGYSADQAA